MTTQTLNQHFKEFKESKQSNKLSINQTKNRRKRIGILYSSSWLNEDFENTKKSYTSHKNQVINNFSHKILNGFIYQDREQIKNCCKDFLREIN